jgi:vacuolar-type H+-ATPase subunit F/Vma7
MRVFVIADPESYLAFAVAGIEGQPVESEAEVPPLVEALDKRKVGLVLITEALAAKNREAIDRILVGPGGPLILEIPAASGPLRTRSRATERILSLLRR